MVKGLYSDILTDPEGLPKWKSGWRPNLVVNSCNVLMAALMKGGQDMGGILYWAIGRGRKAWDDQCPLPLPSCARLDSEIARRPVTGNQIVYLDEAERHVESPTGCIEISAEFKGEDFVSSGFQPLREFGVFGGNATGEPESGFLVDYVIHPRIDLPPGFTLNRKLRLSFSANVPKAKPSAMGSGLPVITIDGVGAGYAMALGAAGISTVGELASLDTAHKIGSIPMVKLREFRAKAGLVLRLQIGPESVMHFADADIGSVIDGTVKTDGSNLSKTLLSKVQDELEMLHVCIDKKQMGKIRLRDLFGE